MSLDGCIFGRGALCRSVSGHLTATIQTLTIICRILWIILSAERVAIVSEDCFFTMCNRGIVAAFFHAFRRLLIRPQE